MTILDRTRRTVLATLAVSVLVLGTVPLAIGTASAQIDADSARQFVADLEENRIQFLGSDTPQVVLTSSNICSGGNGCDYLAAVTSSMPDAVNAARAQGSGKDLDEMIETFNLPDNIKAVIRDAVAKDMAGNGGGPNEITVAIGDEFDFVALLHMLDFAIATAKGNIP